MCSALHASQCWQRMLARGSRSRLLQRNTPSSRSLEAAFRAPESGRQIAEPGEPAMADNPDPRHVRVSLQVWQTHLSTHSTIVSRTIYLGSASGAALDWARLGGRRGPRYCSRNSNDLIDICEKVGDLVSPWRGGCVLRLGRPRKWAEGGAVYFASKREAGPGFS